jgi:hypothetical protein
VDKTEVWRLCFKPAAGRGAYNKQERKIKLSHG